MRRLLKVLAVVFVVALATQTPFIYRRYQLGRLDARIRELNAARAPDTDAVYADYKGAIHVHSFLGGHSAGTFAEIIAAAQANGLAFVVMTEHPSGDYDTRAQTLRGMRGGVLFIAGSETSESDTDRFLTFSATLPPYAPPEAVAAPPTTQARIDRARAAGQLVFVAHPETFRSWGEARGFDGMEIYNLHADAKGINRTLLFFDGLWSYRSYPHLLWTRFSQNPDANLRRFDELTNAEGGDRRKLVAIAGNDAHANVGLIFQDLAGHTIFSLRLDPYERSFQVVRTHVLSERARPLNEETLLASLAAGHAYVAFDILCDATGFRFTAENGRERKLMGDEITRAEGAGVRFRVATPVNSRIQIIRNGQVLSEAREVLNHEWTTTEAGVYRVVCYLPQLPAPLDAKPWIISNPIYVR
ncbi:MAG TPA: hypothetical protein VF656_08775 [Pyrinomonadaceae bacterium]|jgi:hypothetical protein